MSRATCLCCALAVFIAAGLAGSAFATTTLEAKLVATGLTRPVFVTSPPGDTQRLFIVEQRGTDNRGRIKIVKNGALLSQPFLTTAVLASSNEQGLLGLAFAPDYATSGRFYIYYTASGGTSQLYRHTVSANPDSANPTGQLIYSVAQPFTNHNGGWLAFGPDGYLYMALGDGGSAGDPGDRAQNLTTPLGKLLRFDVSGAGNAVAPPDNPFYGATFGADEVWSFGLRNPWRCSFDRETNDLIIGDVGQTNWEEIDFAPADSLGGKGWNWGWRCYEGNNAYTSSTTTPCGSCQAAGCPLKFPAYVFNHSLGRCSVTGGYVYRGCAIPDLRGTYFFADYCGDQIYAGRFVNGLLTGVVDRASELEGTQIIDNISSFGEDAEGELYICDLDGQVYQIVPRNPVVEADMPALSVTTSAGPLGCTTPGNAILPGITPFADAGSRIADVGSLRNGTLLACTQLTPTTLTASVNVGGKFDVDIEGEVLYAPLAEGLAASIATLTRTLRFTNVTTQAQPLVFVDVVAPYLAGDADLGGAYGEAGHGESALLAIYEATVSSPALAITHRGVSATAVMTSDVDDKAALVARVAADQPLAGRASAGPGQLAMALRFDLGVLAPGASDSVQIVTVVQSEPPVDSGVPPEFAQPALRFITAQPFRDDLQMALHLPAAGRAQVEIFDVRGRRVRSLLDRSLSRGQHAALWDGRDDRGRSLGAGLYLVRLTTADAVVTRRAVRVR